MNTDLLEYFLTVTKFMNITRAAEYLYMTQPTLSKKIIALENELDTKLFARNGRNIELTQAGKLVQQAAEEITSKLSLLNTQLAMLAQNITGTLNIEAEPIYEDSVFEMYSKFHGEYPNIQLNVLNSNFKTVRGKLYDCSADIGMVRSFELDELRNNGKFDVWPLFNDRSCLCVSEKHRLANKTSVTLNDIRGETFTALKYMHRGGYFDRLEKSINFLPESERPVTFTDMIQSIRIKNLVAFVEAGIPSDNYRGCKLLEIADIKLEHSIEMIWKKDNDNPALKAFLRILKALYPSVL